MPRPWHAGAGRSSWRAFAAAARAAQAAGLGVNAGHDLNRDNLADFLRAVPGVQEVSIGHALIADALELGLPRPCATTSAASAAAARRQAAVIVGIGTDICDVRRMRATLERRGERFAERVLGRRAGRSSTPAARGRGARRGLPGHALLGQGGLLQGHRPGHPHADDLARLRDPQRPQRQALHPPHGVLAEWFDARRCRRMSPSPTNRLRRVLRRRRDPWSAP
jgi:hypothetical protein